MHSLTLSAAFLALSSAFLLYGLSYDTRQIEARVHGQERLAEKARSDIAILKAERAHLARPDRIEPLARAQGLAPLGEQQIAGGSGSSAIVTGSTAR
ncbi:MAG: cell division protein FtsL [Hyphomicrobium sp.]|jgi:cell division protein FtsL